MGSRDNCSQRRATKVPRGNQFISRGARTGGRQGNPPPPLPPTPPAMLSSRAKLLHCMCTTCILRTQSRDTHPRIPVTYLVARQSTKAHMRTMELPSTWYSTVPMNNPLRLVKYNYAGA